MFQLSVQDVHPGGRTGDKEETIRQLTVILVQAGSIAEGYVSDILVHEQQTSTFFGGGIAIPHGTTSTRDQVLRIDVQVFQFPKDVTRGDGQVACVTIGTTASSDEHLGLLRRLTHILNDDSVAEQLRSATTAEELCALLVDKKQGEQLKLDNEMLTLDIAASGLLILQALSAVHPEEVRVVGATFATRTINGQPLSLEQGIWLSDSTEDSLRSAIMINRAANVFDVDDETATMLVSVTMNGDQPITVLKYLADLLLDNKANRLLKTDATMLLALLTNDGALTNNVLSAEFVVCNEHSLHARLDTVLVSTVKRFNSDIIVTGLDGAGKPANGHSLMKVVALGARKDHRLRFTVQGVDAEQTLEAIDDAIAAGLGEGA